MLSAAAATRSTCMTFYSARTRRASIHRPVHRLPAGNWTKSNDGSAIVGHHDRIGLKDTRHMSSWNSSHGSRGCSQDNLKGTGGAGLIYCFLAN